MPKTMMIRNLYLALNNPIVVDEPLNRNQTNQGEPIIYLGSPQINSLNQNLLIDIRFISDLLYFLILLSQSYEIISVDYLVLVASLSD